MNRDEDIIIHPRKGKNEKPLPANGVMLVTPAEARCGHDVYISSGGKRQFLYNSTLTVAADRLSFCAGPAVGAPMAAMTMEKLIALGARRIVMFGWCGAAAAPLSVGDLVIGGRPVHGEGTSCYYPVDKGALPSARAVDDLRRLCVDEAKLSVHEGAIWTTDAPYREDRKYIAKLVENDDVVAVDMEYTALCSVAAFRGVEFAAVFLVSDLLYEKGWRTGARDSGFKEMSDKIIGLLLGRSGRE